MSRYVHFWPSTVAGQDLGVRSGMAGGPGGRGARRECCYAGGNSPGIAPPRVVRARQRRGASRREGALRPRNRRMLSAAGSFRLGPISGVPIERMERAGPTPAARVMPGAPWRSASKRFARMATEGRSAQGCPCLPKSCTGRAGMQMESAWRTGEAAHRAFLLSGSQSHGSKRTVPGPPHSDTSREQIRVCRLHHREGATDVHRVLRDHLGVASRTPG